MATHRPQDKSFAPEFEFQVALDVLEISEVLAARRRRITLHTIARQFCTRPVGLRPTVPQIQAALEQIQTWRGQILINTILQHRRQVVRLLDHITAEQRRLSEDSVYLARILQETNHLLQNCLRDNDEPKPTTIRPDGADYPLALRGIAELPLPSGINSTHSTPGGSARRLRPARALSERP